MVTDQLIFWSEVRHFLSSTPCEGDLDSPFHRIADQVTEVGTILKAATSKRRHISEQMHTLQRWAAIESIMSNNCYRIRNGYSGETDTTFESAKSWKITTTWLWWYKSGEVGDKIVWFNTLEDGLVGGGDRIEG